MNLGTLRSKLAKRIKGRNRQIRKFKKTGKDDDAVAFLLARSK